MEDFSDIIAKLYVHYDSPNNLPSEKQSGESWVALLIDADGFNIDMDAALSEAQKLGTVVVKRLYANFHTHAKFTAWRRLHKKYQFERRIMLGIHKNIADMAVVADGVELAIMVPLIDTFVIVSHDGGFFPLIHKLYTLNKKVYWIGGQKPYLKATQLREKMEKGLADADYRLINGFFDTNLTD